MVPVYEIMLVLFSHFILLVLADAYNDNSNGECPASFKCGYLHNISFPFTKTERQDCGLLPIQNCDADTYTPKMIQLQNTGKWFKVLRVGQSPPNFQFRDDTLYKNLESQSCEAFSNNYTLPTPTSFHFAAFRIKFTATLFRCNHTLHVPIPPNTTVYSPTKCPHYDLYYSPFFLSDDADAPYLKACTKVRLPIKDVPDAKDPFTFITADIYTEVKLTDECQICHYDQRGKCGLDGMDRFCCVNGLGVGIPTAILMIGFLFLFLLYIRKHAASRGHLESRNSSSNYTTNPHQESSSVYFGIPLFSYEQLKEATNNFDHTKELGDGGFGTVYYGKLPDGREVAVKRLYEHNYRRVEQFMNEVEILTRLRHKNLVSLYGCTSRHSRELLLVYEYISNGTVACHLYGGLAKPGSLPWSTRMKIAIETATALAYLHASEIVHRDVKSSNILLDNNYCVKVADFGLSRLFPIDVTHVSTAPQGSPGYLDPEYYQCYQLTDKSDVYSFGVVLIELISSKPPVDMNRSKDEINLSNLAVKKIQEGVISELVDPSLGYVSDNEVKRMMVSVAELAFQCLQREKESRPSMDKVLHELRIIESGKDEVAGVEDVVGVSHSSRVHSPPPASPVWDEVGLLKNVVLPTSPNTVTDKWESKHTTPNASG
ncbi:hypothetical protein RJT34_25503 [Clitoria ternatea]|uniref:non-specific serine/threonine protein kinase n=1 Tax=Clitoria ternatea TaxID=43366 RepID=A0AAN9FPZ7_CLITE